MDSMTHPNWAYALEVLRTFMPRGTTFNVSELLTEELDLVQCGLEQLDNEIDRFNRLVELTNATLEGLVIVVGDSSFQGAGPYFVSLEGFEKFLIDQEYSLLTGGDVVLLCPKTDTCILLHHDGYAALVVGGSSD